MEGQKRIVSEILEAERKREEQAQLSGRVRQKKIMDFIYGIAGHCLWTLGREFFENQEEVELKFEYNRVSLTVKLSGRTKGFKYVIVVQPDLRVSTETPNWQHDGGYVSGRIQRGGGGNEMKDITMEEITRDYFTAFREYLKASQSI